MTFTPALASMEFMFLLIFKFFVAADTSGLSNPSERTNSANSDFFIIYSIKEDLLSLPVLSLALS